MYKNLQYQTPDHDMILATRDDGTMVAIEPDDAVLWATVSTMDVADYTPPPEPTAEELLAAEREVMQCSTAQMGLAMLDAGVDDGIFATDPKAMVIWQKATHVARRGPILEAMLKAMDDDAVDELFRAAMDTRV